MPGAEHRAHMELPATRTSPGVARRFLSDTLHEWHVPDAPVDTACLLATELVTNAVLHAGTTMELVLETTHDTLRVEVVDHVDRMPVARTDRGPSLGITGRGLALVRNLAETWGVTPHDAGKAVWFELPLAHTA